MSYPEYEIRVATYELIAAAAVPIETLKRIRVTDPTDKLIIEDAIKAHTILAGQLDKFLEYHFIMMKDNDEFVDMVNAKLDQLEQRIVKSQETLDGLKKRL